MGQSAFASSVAADGHWSVRLLIVVVVVLAAVVAYVILMSLGMPGMDHTPTGGSAPSSQSMLAPAFAPASGR